MSGGLGGLFAPAVADGVVYVNVNTVGAPRVVGLDAASGDLVLQSEAVNEPGAFTNASAVVFEDMLFMGVSGGEGGNARPGGFAIFQRTGPDAGALLKRTYTIPQSDYDLGYAGGSVWGTAAVDTQTRYAYVGTGQPSTGKKEHQHINALIKIDLDRTRPTFGQIVDGYKGTPDTYLPNLAKQPACSNAPATPVRDFTNMGELGCFQLDLDFGASPNLFTDPRGYEVVGALQKAGIFHAAYADTMQQAWATTVNTQVFPAALANGSSSAVGANGVYTVASYPGQMFSLAKEDGAYNWVAPVLDGFHYNPVSAANGVVYVTDTKGFLNTFDETSGLLVSTRAMSLDTGSDVCVNLAGGVAIARNTVYAICDTGLQGGGWVIAYRLPE